jgi:hypothetical protein
MLEQGRARVWAARFREGSVYMLHVALFIVLASSIATSADAQTASTPVAANAEAPSATASRPPLKDAPSTPSDGPTMQETSSWLATTLRNYGGFREPPSGDGTDLNVRITDAGIDNDCSFYFVTKEVMVSYYDGKLASAFSQENKMVIPLGAVRMITESWEERGRRHDTVSISTAPVTAIRAMQDSNKVNAVSEVYFAVDRMPEAQLGAEAPQSPSEMIPHIEKALKHAVDLCQGTYRKPQSKELF